MSNLPAIQAFTKDLATQSKSLASMLPEGLDVKKFCRTVVTGISTHKQRDQLLSADRESLFNSCQKAASDGLMLDGKEATLVTFKNEVVYMPMTQGLIKLARNSNEIKNIIAQVVYKADSFSYKAGIDDQPIFDPDWFGERGEAVGAYAVITLKNGEKINSILTKKRIMQIASGGKNGYQYDPARGQHFEEWWKKTAIKNVLKYAPKSTSLEMALEKDNDNFDPDKMVIEGQATPASTSDLNDIMDSEPAPSQQNQTEAQSDVIEGEILPETSAEDVI